MSPPDVSPTSPSPQPSPAAARPGGVRFLPEADRIDLCTQLGSGRFVVAAPLAAQEGPGHLQSVLEEAVEGALALRGALPPSVAVGARLEACIADQIFRMRALGARGLVLAPPRLDAFVEEDGVLGLEDSRTLGAWIRASSEHPLLLVLDERDEGVQWLQLRALGELRPPPPPAPEATAPAQVEPPALEAAAPLPRRERAELEPLAPSPAPVGRREREAEPRRAARSPLRPTAEPSPAFVSRLLDAAAYREHALQLDEAKGPKPIATVEKLFVAHYLPLLAAVGGGLGQGAIRDVVDEWRNSFTHSYLEAFAVLRATGKRPSMVLDVPELAAKASRLNGARKTSLVLIDALRFDLGQLVQEKLRPLTAGRALCVEERLLWAALPTTSSVQAGLLARGPEGLRELGGTLEPELLIERGRAVSTLRRERIGSREVLKLDLVEARLREYGASQEERLDAIAEEVATVLARHLESLPPRTLVYVFGDHGFQLPIRDGGRSTGPASQGGASPEEVLVPGYAWLVDGLH